MILHTGGAVGADMLFENVFKEIPGTLIRAYSFRGHNTESNHRVILIDDELQEGLLPITKAASKLQRRLPTNAYVRNLLLRNYYQVKDSDVIFAVSSLDATKQNVNGGTGWAVAMAQDMGKPIWLFDQRFNKWLKWENSKWSLGIPNNVLKPDVQFAGIGSRELTDAGRNEIIALAHDYCGANHLDMPVIYF